MSRRPTLFVVLVVVAFLTTQAAAAQTHEPDPSTDEPADIPADVAVGTVFTYQGYLTEGSDPASGAYDLEFRLYDAASGGSQVGATVHRDTVSVSNGLFTVQLDFGDIPFDGNARWLEIGVRPQGGTGYSTVATRQALTATPYALHAESASWNGIDDIPLGFADGVDDNTVYSAGDGLDLTGSVLAVDVTDILGTGLSEASNDIVVSFGGTGGASTAARSDHNHDGVYAQVSHNHFGDSWSGSAVHGLRLDNLSASSPDLILGGSGILTSNPNDVESDLTISSQDSVYVTAEDGVFDVESAYRLTLESVNSRVELISGGTGDIDIESSDDIEINSDDDIRLGSGDITRFESNDDVKVYLDYDDTESCEFTIYNGSGYEVFSVNESGDMFADGTKSAVVETESFGTRALYAVESPEVRFEDFGSARLVDGIAVIEIDPMFAETANLSVDYQVFLTPIDAWAALYVTNKTATSFEVRDASGTASINFDYRIAAKRLGFEAVRMESTHAEAP